MGIFDNTPFRLIGLILLISLPIVLISFIIGRFTQKAIIKYLPEALIALGGIILLAYSRTVTESMLDLAYAIMGMILIMSAAASTVILFIISLIKAKRLK